MKRLITFAVTILTAVCFVACTVTGGDKKTAPNGLSDSFQAAVFIELDELDAEGTLKRFGSGMWEIEFTSPNTLSGVKLSFDEGNVTASYKGLNFSVPQSALPVKAMMLNLISAAESLATETELTGEEDDGMIEIEGTLDGGEYTLTVDKNGNIFSFEMPNNDLEMHFTDVRPIDAESTTVASTEAVSTEAETTAVTSAA